MATRGHAPAGSPCWVDLSTSDVDGSRRFYAELLGWEPQAPSPEFGGYFMFTRGGVPVAGAMGAMAGSAAVDRWSVYLATYDIERTLRAAQAAGAEVVAPAMAVADLGVQAGLIDPTGAPVGVWQAGTFPGFTVLAEPGAPAWFELYTADHGKAVAFYRDVFGWQTRVLSDTDEFRYTVQVGPDDGDGLAGILDARDMLVGGAPARWAVYFTVADADGACERVGELGGSVSATPSDTPFGRIATVADPTGASFLLHQARA